VTTVTDPEADPEWWSFSAWLGRQTGRTDGMGKFAKAHLAGDPEATVGTGLARARFEWGQWHATNYPRSAAARAASERLRHETTKVPTRLDTRPPDGEGASLEAIFTGALADIAELFGELVPLKAPELQLRPRRALGRLNARIAALRSATQSGT